MATFRPAVEQYRPLLQRLGPDLPIDFMMASIDEESGGNNCSLGIPGVEAGIMQTFHPSDDRFGATFSQLRTNCSGQIPIRPLTADEQLLQARVAVNAIRQFRDQARQRLAAVGATWSESSNDFWNFVKLGHGLPAMQTDLLRQITASLGRPPASWDEFKAITLSMAPAQFPPSLVRFAAAASVRGLQNRIADVLVNAENAGKFGGGFIGAVLSNPAVAIVALGGAAAVLIYLIRRRRRG
jgi:hypothetical protein